MAANLSVSLFLQREADEKHQVECSICYYATDVETPTNSIAQLYAHGRSKHVLKKIHPKTLLLSSAIISNQTGLPNVTFGTEFGRLLKILKNLTFSQDPLIFF